MLLQLVLKVPPGVLTELYKTSKKREAYPSAECIEFLFPRVLVIHYRGTLAAAVPTLWT